MYKKNYKILLKLFFNEFKYISFIISLAIVLLITAYAQRYSKIQLISDFIILDFKYLNKNDELNLPNKSNILILDIKEFTEYQKKNYLIEFFSNRNEIFSSINKELSLRKINLDFKKNDIVYDLDKKIIKFILSKSLSYYDHQEIENHEIDKLQKIFQNELNKILNENNLPLRSYVRLDYLYTTNITYLKIISSIFFLTIIINFLFLLIKYRKKFL